MTNILGVVGSRAALFFGSHVGRFAFCHKSRDLTPPPSQPGASPSTRTVITHGSVPFSLARNKSTVDYRRRLTLITSMCYHSPFTSSNYSPAPLPTIVQLW